MKFNKNARLDPSQVGGSSGGGRGRPMAIGGGLGGLVIVIVLVVLFGPGVLDGTGGLGQPGGGGGGGTALQHCDSGDDIGRDQNCRFVAYVNDIQDYWGGAMEGYRQAQLITFDGSVATACGQAGSDVGPFYCPADEKVYLDLAFLGVLFDQLGAEGGKAAEAYVVAHEFGHHVQNLTGVMAEAQRGDQRGADSPAVRLELQADCYAGVWFAHAAEDPDGPVAEVSAEDVRLAQDAAIAVGDDHIQRRSGGGVDPDGWTHGSSEQRKKWLMVGLESGDPNRCDTFSGDI